VLSGAIPQARGSLDGRTRAALERRPRTVRSPGALPLERRGVGSRHKISRAGGASATESRRSVKVFCSSRARRA
ncbi:unnamed protein product, partial [Ectocarpus sp. 12 AP-2014]